MVDRVNNLQELIRSFDQHGDKPAIIALREGSAEVVSYGELFRKIAALATGLSRKMLEGGNIIALMAGNSPEWIMVALAVIQAGGVLLPIDQQADEKTIEHIIRDSGATLLFTSREQARRVAHLEPAAKLSIFLLDQSAGEQSWLGLAGDTPGEQAGSEPERTAVLFYTSGTTGPPKGVPLSHANLASQLKAMKDANLIAADDRVLMPLPLHHVYPFVIGMLTPLSFGLPVIFPKALTGQDILRAVGEGRASIIIGVPRLYRALYEGIHSRIRDRGAIAATVFDLLLAFSMLLRRHFGILAGKDFFSFLHRKFGTSLRVLASGGSAMDARLARRLEGLGWQVAIGYGLTETAPLLTIHPPGAGKLESVGRAVTGVEIRIAPGPVANEGSDQAGDQGGAGEVVVRGPNVFRGYLHLEEKTAESFTENGWFRTGDLGLLDDQGFLYLQGRASTLIITESGKNIQPDELEEAYAAHPAIGEIGILSKEGRLAGIIVPDLKMINRNGLDIEQAIRQAVSQQAAKLPSYKSLAEYAITREALPRTRLGKIRRHLLAELYTKARSGEPEEEMKKGAIPLSQMSDHDQALLEDGKVREIWKWLAQRYADKRLTPDSSTRFDLGIDSLEWLDISLEIQQRTGMELSEEVIGRIDTVRNLLEELSSRSRSEESVDPERPLKDPYSVLDEDQKRWLKPQGAVLSALSYGLYLINRVLMKGWFRLQVKGRENLPAHGQCLITPNHLSVLDPLVVGAAIPYAVLRRTYFAGWTGMAFKNVFFRFISRLAQAVPIDDRHAISSSLAFGSAVLGRGSNLIWFPEGGRSPDGTLREFKPGIALLLEHHDIPVLPVFIHGTYEAQPKGRKFPRPVKITVTFGKPLTRDELQQGQPEESFRDRIRNGLRKEVEGLRNEK